MGQETEKKLFKVDSFRYREYYNIFPTLDSLYSRSQWGENFRSLMELIASPDNIMLAYRSIKSNKGSNTPGTDGLTIQYYSEMRQDEFIKLVQTKLRNYHSKPVRRKEIDKGNGKTRPLGIPCMIDRIIQQCFLQILEPICEAKFYEHSYGFRPLRSAEHAIAAFQDKMVRSKLYYVVDVDIKGFFDNVDHRKLLRQLWSMGIHDSRVLMVIKQMLKAPIQMPDGTIVNPAKGTQQGGIISPLLANVVLNDLDWWIHSQWLGQIDVMDNLPKVQKNKDGYPHYGNVLKALRRTDLKEIYIFRYADDFKILCKSRSDAEKTLRAVTEWLEKTLHLEVSKEKTKITNVRKQYSEFLGIKIKLVKDNSNSRHKWVLHSHMTDKARKKAKVTIKKAIIAVQKSGNIACLHNNIDKYNSIVRGIHNYYRIATCIWKDFMDIEIGVRESLHNRIEGLKKPPPGKLVKVPEWIRPYTKSKRYRTLMGKPFIPVGYVQFKKPFHKDKDVNMYTETGREIVHTNLILDTQPLNWMRENPDGSKSVAYNDNRLSRYAGQYGKCTVTGQPLVIGNIFCIYKDPNCQENPDSYFNLLLVSNRGKRMLETVNPATVETLIRQIFMTKEQIKRLNELREIRHLPTVNLKLSTSKN